MKLKMVDAWIWRDYACGHEVQIALCDLQPHHAECHIEYEKRVEKLKKSCAGCWGVLDSQLLDLGINGKHIGFGPQRIKIGFLIEGLPE